MNKCEKGSNCRYKHDDEEDGEVKSEWTNKVIIQQAKAVDVTAVETKVWQNDRINRDIIELLDNESKNKITNEVDEHNVDYNKKPKNYIKNRKMLLDKLSKEISSSRTDDRNLEQIHPNRNQAHIFTIELKSKGENEDETYYAGNGMGKIIGKIDQRLQRKFEYTLDTHCMDIDETNIDVKVNDAKNEIFNVQLTDIKVKVIEVEVLEWTFGQK